MEKKPAPKVVFSRLGDANWEQRGLRGFLEYRDLGIAEATGGRFGGSIARTVKAWEPGGGSGRHHHTVGLHFIYVLRGWLRTEFDGLGEVVMHAGDCICYEGEVPQEHIEYSDDYEVMQITMPADYKTTPLPAK